MPAEPGKVLAYQWHLGKPAVHVHAEQLGNIRGRKIKPLSIQIRELGKLANRRIHGMNFAIAAIEDPFQNPAVLAESGPEEFALVVGAEPVHVKDPGQLGARPVADAQKVSEVIAHVVAEEGKHGHRVTAKFADFASGGRGGFAAARRAHKRSVLPTERLGDQRHNASAASTEKDRIDRHALRIVPLRSNHRALTCRNGEASIGVSRPPGRSRSPRAAQPVDQLGGLFAGHLLPPYVAVESARAIGEDGIPGRGEHGVGVRPHAGSGSHTEEAALGIDGVKAAIGAELHPGNIVADGFDFPPRYRRDHHGKVRLAAGRGKRARKVLDLAGGVDHLEDEHVLRHPAFVTGLHRSNAQRVTLLAK